MASDMADGELSFDVYFRTSTAVITLAREVSFRVAHRIARQVADPRCRQVLIRNRVTKAVAAVGPVAARRE